MSKFKRSPLHPVALVTMITAGCMGIISGCMGPLPAMEGASSTDAHASPPSGEAPPSSAAAAGSASPFTESVDGGTAPHMPFHMMTVTLCSRDKEACALAQAKSLDVAGEGAPYRVAFGSTVGSIRSHQQALADVYRELRDRTEWGTHLACQSRTLAEPAPDGGIPSDAGGAAPPPARPPASNAALNGSSDAPTGAEAMANAAFHVMVAVDNVGEVTIDVGPTQGNCSVSLGESGAERCVVGDVPRKSAPSKGGISF